MLKGLVALVTGASRGIGRADVLELARLGADIVVADVAPADDTAEEARKLGVRAIAVELDVTDYDMVESVVETVIEEFNKIDVLVNNAGITRDNLLLRMDHKEWDDVIATNLTGTFNTTSIIGKYMLRQRSGSIINISSVAGVAGNAGQCNYAASKAGVIGFTKSCARELAARGIRANVVAPGFIATDMTDVLPERVKTAALNNIPMKRLGTPEDVARVVAFLAGPGSQYITGQVILVDGGMAM